MMNKDGYLVYVNKDGEQASELFKAKFEFDRDNLNMVISMKDPKPFSSRAVSKDACGIQWVGNKGNKLSEWPILTPDHSHEYLRSKAFIISMS